jgi:hypothetical protein
MSAESIISLFLGIPIGLISGLYTGLIVTRYTRFADLRNEALRIIHSINFMEVENVVHITNDEDVSKLLLISSDLLSLHHRKAGERVSQLLKDITSITCNAKAGRVNVADYGSHYKAWQEIARELPPSQLVLWTWGKL